MERANQSDFLNYLAIPMGGLVGFLIALPITLNSPFIQAAPILLLGVACGAMVGYRRRQSRAFLYFALFAAATISTLIFFQT